MAAKPSPIADFKRAISPIPEIIEEAREGRMFILVDEEDRENEGDLVIPGAIRDAGASEFHGQARARPDLPGAHRRSARAQLGLEPMTPRNQTRMGTAFTVSIEAREGVSTGISAHDRAHTIAVAIDASKGADDIVSPGPRVSADGARWRRAGARGPHRSERRHLAPGGAQSVGGDLRDHERRRHHGAAAGTGRLRAIPQSEDRRHRRIDRLSPRHRALRRSSVWRRRSRRAPARASGWSCSAIRLDDVEHAALGEGRYRARQADAGARAPRRFRRRRDGRRWRARRPDRPLDGGNRQGGRGRAGAVARFRAGCVVASACPASADAGTRPPTTPTA